MIASVIGRTFLNAFNDKYGLSMSAKEFFEDHYFKLFYDHPKYMQWITNSPPVQGITTDDKGQYGIEVCKVKLKDDPADIEQMLTIQKLKYGAERISIKTERGKGVLKGILLNDSKQRAERLIEFQRKIAVSQPDGSIAIGFPASDEEKFASTSGLVSDISISTTEEDVFLSWIGSGLGLGVGEYSIFFDHPEILLRTFEGWQVYRRFLNEVSLKNLRGNQINTWNGQWLAFAFGKDFKEPFDYSYLEQIGIFQLNGDVVEANTIKWTDLFFSISRRMNNATFIGYVYSVGDRNKTIGFIPFQFYSGTRLIEVYRKLFREEKRLDVKGLESLFGLHIKRACELGSIGLQALRPQKLKGYFHNTANLSFKNEEDTLSYHAYKTWLKTMLSKNKEEITDYTESVAEALHRFRAAGTKTDRNNLLVNEMFPAKTKKVFLDGLVQVIKDAADNDLPLFKQLRNEVHLMSNEEFGYFATLLKFDYAYQDRNSKK